MNPATFRKTLTGVIGFPVTPFKAGGALDLDALRKNVKAMLLHPFCAVVAPGGTGEVYSLTPDEHLEVVRAVVEEAGGKCPVIAGAVGGTPMAVACAKRAAEAGASGILALPPSYPDADAEGLVEHYRAVGGATELGLVVYSRDSVHPTPAEVERLARAVPTLVAWKEGKGDLRRLQAIMNRLGDRLHWIGGAGDDLVGPYYSLGIRVYTSSISNVAPRLSLELHDGAAKGDSARLKPLMDELVVPLYEMRARRRGYEVSVMKAMMELLDMDAGPPRPPLVRMAPKDLEDLRAMIPRWRPWVE